MSCLCTVNPQPSAILHNCQLNPQGANGSIISFLLECHIDKLGNKVMLVMFSESACVLRQCNKNFPIYHPFGLAVRWKSLQDTSQAPGPRPRFLSNKLSSLRAYPLPPPILVKAASLFLPNQALSPPATWPTRTYRDIDRSPTYSSLSPPSPKATTTQSKLRTIFVFSTSSVLTIQSV